MQAARKAPVRFRERSELLDFLLEVSAATVADAGSGSTAGQRRRDRQEGAALRPVRHPALQREAPRPAHPLRRGPSRRGSPQPVGDARRRHHRSAAARREPVLVGDVRNDPRYLNAVDAVRTELAVPMIARGKLVGVIDLQSTRVNAYTEYDRALLRLIAARVAIAIDNARLYRRVERQNRTLKTLAHISREFSSILDLNELLRQDRQHHARADQLRRVQHPAGGPRAPRRCATCSASATTSASISTTFRWERESPARPPNRARWCACTTPPRIRATSRRIPTSAPKWRVPLIVQDRVVGVMDLESDRVGYFTDDHVRTLTLLAPQVASSVENARLYQEVAQRERRMEEDLKAARELQRVLLPDAEPEIEGLEAAVRLRPAREISGDIYDIFEHRDGQTVIAFGDVSGKGAAAALYGGLMSGLLRTLRAAPPASRGADAGAE